MVLWCYGVIQLYSEELADIRSCKNFKFINNSREIKTGNITGFICRSGKGFNFKKTI